MIPSIHSIGSAAGQLQRSTMEISEAAKLLGVEPSIRINGIDHFPEDGIRKVAEHFRTGDRSTANAQPEPRH